MAEKKAQSPAVPKSTITTVVSAIAGVALGFVIGHFAIAPATGNVTNIGTTTTTQDNMNQVICTYTTHGATKTITLGDAINYLGGTTNAKGGYDVPSAENIIALARDQIIKEAAAAENITITNEQIEEYAKQNYSVSSIKEMADTYGYEENQIIDMIKTTLVTQTLIEKQAGKIENPPEYPAAPEDENAVTKEGADYIISLAGEDNFKDGQWVSPDGVWAKGMEGQNFSANGADYQAMLTAYQIAYQTYSEEYSEQQAKWKEYVNELLKDSTIAIGTLIQ